MHSRRLVLGSAAALVCIATVAATVNLRQINSRNATVPAPGKAHLYAYGGRTPQQRAAAPARMDAALAGIAAHAVTGASAASLADLRNFNPAARFRPASAGGAPEVAIDAATHGDAQQLKSALVALGLEHPAVFANSVGGFLPVSAINAAAASPEVAYIHASLPHRRGVVATQGDYAQQSYAVRQANPSLTGAGVTVGVISDSFDCYAVYAAAGSGVPASGNDGYASNGFTATAEDDEASGALPAASAINVLAEPYTASGPATATGNCLDYGAPTQLPFSDEGRAMMQIVHAVAPGANLAFYTGDNSEADFATAVTTLASPVSSGGAGAKVIADDLGYYDEPFYQDGIVAQAIDTVEAQGVAYFSAAGNNGNASWESTSPSFPVLQSSSAANNAGEYLLNFDTTNATTATALPITLSPLVPGEYVAIVVEWDQPYVTGAPNSGGATNQIDICVTGASTGVVVQDYAGHNVTCTGLNATGADPVQVLIVGNSAAATSNTPTQNLDLYVGTNNQSTAPHRLIVSVETDGQTSPAPIASFSTNSETIQGHPNAAGAATVAAAFYFDTPQCGTTPTQLEAYSSQGGAPILFSSAGTRLATPQVRQKPNFVGPDGVNNTFLGFTLASAGDTGANGLLPNASTQCQNDPSYPNFFGTSAATPHAAGIAALLLQANSTLTPTEIYTALETTATAIGAVPTTGANPTYNFEAGYGFINAEAAFASIPGGPPMLSLAANSITLGGSTTITWSSVGTSSCTASGAWTGMLAASGSQPLTPTATGTQTYTLTCTSAASGATLPSASVTLDVTAPTPTATLTASANSIVVGSTATLTWVSANATGCTASGSWSGALATSGSQTVTPSAAGSDTYTLICSNGTVNSSASSVTLTVSAKSAGGGGGTLDGISLLVLGGIAVAARREARRRRIRL